MADAIKDLTASLPESQKIYQRNARVLAQEIVGTVFIPYPFYVREAKGARVTDVDGKEYIDLTMGFGPLLLGHSPDIVIEAATEAARTGLHMGLPTPYQGELAELVVDATPCAEKAIFCNSGTEATMYAMRVSRAYTGKDKVALFEGSYHGSHDYVLTEADKSSERLAPHIRSRGSGVPQATLDQLLLLPYRSDAAFDLIRQHKDELAAVIVEPVQSSNPRTDVGPFLRELSDVCRECDVLMILDEIITGFRFGYGGAQEYFNVTPDLITYGKIIGGGIPIGAVAGPSELMSLFHFTGDEDADPKGAIFSGGTFGGNPMAMRVGAAVLKHLRGHPEIYEHLSSQSQRLGKEINDFLETEGIAARLMQAESMFQLVFQKEPVESAWDVDDSTWQTGANFYARLHVNGVIVPGIHLFFLSAAHTSEDVDTIIEAFKRTFAETR